MHGVYFVQVELYAKETVRRSIPLRLKPIGVEDALLIDHLAYGALPTFGIGAKPMVERALQVGQQTIDLRYLATHLVAPPLQALLLATGGLPQFGLFRLILGGDPVDLAFHGIFLGRIFFLGHSQLLQLFPHLLDVLSPRVPLAEFPPCAVSSVLLCRQRLQPFVRLMSPVVEGLRESIPALGALFFQSLALRLLNGLLLIVCLFLSILERLMSIFQFSSGNLVFLLYRGVRLQKVVL